MTTSNTSRRQFLRNTALATLSAGVVPTLVSAKENKVLECKPTTLDYYGQGPFYSTGPPQIVNNQLASATEPGIRLILSGLVKTLDCNAVIADTALDIWHANDAGEYDTQGYNLRGITKSNAQGFYMFETILPGKYLNGSSYRPRHIHIKISPPGFTTLTTQLYFEGDTDIPEDAAASISSGTYDARQRIIPIALNGQGKYEGTWDIMVNGNATGVEDLHTDKGIIYSVSPNPISDRVEIRYGIYQAAKVSIQVFDMKGSQVAALNEENLEPEKYSATWNPDGNLLPGMYFVVLKLNDLHVHYFKIIKY